MARLRIDELLVLRELVADLREARARIMAGEVVAGERRIDKAGEQVAADSPVRLRLRKPHGYVSRGGLKLAGALVHFGVDVTGYTCLDLGASTGGFTDCLLQSGASRVYAVDVAYGILDWKLQQDDRVVNLERTHAADLTKETVPEFIQKSAVGVDASAGNYFQLSLMSVLTAAGGSIADAAST